MEEANNPNPKQNTTKINYKKHESQTYSLP